MGQAQTPGSLRDEGGIAVLMVLPALLGLLLMAAMTMDIGLVRLQKARMQNIADAAALAGAQLLQTGAEYARAAAMANATANGGFGETADAVITGDGNGIRVTARITVPVLMGGLIGKPTVAVEAHATAVLKGVGSVTGVRPFAVEEQAFVYGARYVLRSAPHDSDHGNFGAVALGGTGSSVYRWNIIFGYQGELRVGQWINTEPGLMPGPTQQGIDALISMDPHTGPCTMEPYNPDCTRIIRIIVTGSNELDGRTWVRIKGFALFYLEGVSGSGSECELTGRFLRMVVSSVSVGPDHGLRTAVLEE